MGRLADFGIKLLGPQAIMAAIENEDPAELGKEVADLVDKRLDAQFGDKASYQISSVVVPFFRKFSEAFCNKLMEKKGGA